MSKEELQKTEAALKEIDVARASIVKLREKAARCADLGLTIFTRSYEDFARNLEERIPLQMKVLKGKIPDGWHATKDN